MQMPFKFLYSDQKGRANPLHPLQLDPNCPTKSANVSNSIGNIPVIIPRAEQVRQQHIGIFRRSPNIL